MSSHGARAKCKHAYTRLEFQIDFLHTFHDVTSFHKNYYSFIIIEALCVREQSAHSLYSHRIDTFDERAYTFTCMCVVRERIQLNVRVIVKRYSYFVFLFLLSINGFLFDAYQCLTYFRSLWLSTSNSDTCVFSADVIKLQRQYDNTSFWILKYWAVTTANCDWFDWKKKLELSRMEKRSHSRTITIHLSGYKYIIIIRWCPLLLFSWQ